jgi:ribonuclease BN (tRNA processing enzyme)
MRLEILGCYGNVLGDHRTTAFLINDSILLDAGTVTETLGHTRLGGIKQVVISHTHIDHVKGLFSLVDELALMGGHTIDLTSVNQILDIISQNLFNNLIWPDFTVIPSEDRAVINVRTIELEKTAAVGSVTVKPILMTHTVYTVGCVVKEGDHGFMFTSDTGPTQRFWEVAREEQGIDFIIADVSFPSRLEGLAKISGHMTLSMLVERLDRFGLSEAPVYISHIKPIFLQEIQSELSTLRGRNIRQLEQGTVITL